MVLRFRKQDALRKLCLRNLLTSRWVPMQDSLQQSDFSFGELQAGGLLFSHDPSQNRSLVCLDVWFRRGVTADYLAVRLHADQFLLPRRQKQPY